jgi:Fic family protein
MRLAILEELEAALVAQGPLPFHNEDVWERIGTINTWGSNAIEGNDLDRSDVETLVLKDTSIGGQPVWKVLETVQHARAFMGLFDRISDPITVATSREIHCQVLRGVLPGAGAFRTVDLHIKGSLYRPPPVKMLEAEMVAWEDEYKRRCKEREPVFDLAAWMHHRFEAIRPFDGGNGRVGRLLVNLHFLKHDWPPVNIGLGDRLGYFEALEAGNGGDLSPLLDFLIEVMGGSLLQILDMVGTGDDRLRLIGELNERGSGFTDYLEYMAGEGKVPALRIGNAWHSSHRAIALFNEEGGGD